MEEEDEVFKVGGGFDELGLSVGYTRKSQRGMDVWRRKRKRKRRMGKVERYLILGSLVQ